MEKKVKFSLEARTSNDMVQFNAQEIKTQKDGPKSYLSVIGTYQHINVLGIVKVKSVENATFRK